MSDIPQVLEDRRKKLGLTQKDMLMRIGMSQQQYQRIEAGGDPRLSTLLRVLEGMGLELRLVPREKAQEVDALLNNEARLEMETNFVSESGKGVWETVLGDLED